MFSRVLKSNNQQTQPATSSPAQTSGQAPTTPFKSRTSAHAKSQSTSGPPVPSKIPVPTTPTARSAFVAGSKENHPAGDATGLPVEKERSNYLSFLFSQNQAGAPTTPVKVNPKVQQSTAPPQIAHAHGHHDRYHNPYESEDVHMQTMKNTINPAMLKQLASIPNPTSAHAQSQPSGPVPQRQAPPPPPAQSHLYAAHRNLGSEDVHMRTARHDVKPEKDRQLQPWEKELLDKTEVRRKATVAQICEYLAKGAGLS